MRREIKTDKAPAPVGPYSQAILADGPTLFVSMQLPLDPLTGELVGKNVSQQATQVLNNLKSVIEASGALMSNALKVVVYFTDINDFAAVNEVYGSFFDEPAPAARAALEVTKLPKGASIAMDAVVSLNS
jgi:2-iminobutanoate/2-iminopropanoate deaminase